MMVKGKPNAEGRPQQIQHAKRDGPGCATQPAALGYVKSHVVITVRRSTANRHIGCVAAILKLATSRRLEIRTPRVCCGQQNAIDFSMQLAIEHLVDADGPPHRASPNTDTEENGRELRHVGGCHRIAAAATHKQH
ncbi:MAG: hypothetical protein ACRDL5_17220 [Solirubrobacteraceae bacterium]